jgi:ABC-2 type transport system ATP-binding protein
MAKSDDIISVKHFKMSFGDKKVVEDLSFDVKKGEIFGLLGSNGSGKTTTIRALLGLYQPTGGELLIDGKKFSPEQGTVVGYLPEERGLYTKETVIDVMTYFGKLRGLTNPKEWSLKYLGRVGLGDKIKVRIGKLSSGQQQKIQLGITIMGQPKLLILDEPTKGFDPVNRRLLMDIIDESHKNGASILMITHYMDEVERLCNRAILLKDGVARAHGTIAKIKSEFGDKSMDDIFVDIYEGVEQTDETALPAARSMRRTMGAPHKRKRGDDYV